MACCFVVLSVWAKRLQCGKGPPPSLLRLCSEHRIAVIQHLAHAVVCSACPFFAIAVMQHLAHAVACSACPFFVIAVIQHLAHAVLIHSLSHARGLSHGLCWRRACGRQTRDNDRSSSVKSTTGSSSSRSVASRGRYVSGVCVGVRRQYVSLPCVICRGGSACGICRGGICRGGRSVSRISVMVSMLVHIGVCAYRHARLLTREHDTPRDKRARRDCLSLISQKCNMRFELCICSWPESTLHVCQEVCLRLCVSATCGCQCVCQAYTRTLNARGPMEALDEARDQFQSILSS